MIVSIYAGAEAEKLVCDDLERVKLTSRSDDEYAENHLNAWNLNESKLRLFNDAVC